MRFRLLRRRLTVSAPRMAVRSALPWPLRWFLLALMLGFSAALALWAFEFGRSIAGLDAGSREELKHLRAEVQRLQDESQRHQALVDTSGSLLLAERTAWSNSPQDCAKPRQKTVRCAKTWACLKNSSRLAPTPTASPSEAFRLKSLQECICDGKHS